jgi:hypothetical protein
MSWRRREVSSGSAFVGRICLAAGGEPAPCFAMGRSGAERRPLRRLGLLRGPCMSRSAVAWRAFTAAGERVRSAFPGAAARVATSRVGWRDQCVMERFVSDRGTLPRGRLTPAGEANPARRPSPGPRPRAPRLVEARSGGRPASSALGAVGARAARARGAGLARLCIAKRGQLAPKHPAGARVATPARPGLGLRGQLAPESPPARGWQVWRDLVSVSEVNSRQRGDPTDGSDSVTTSSRSAGSTRNRATATPRTPRTERRGERTHPRTPLRPNSRTQTPDRSPHRRSRRRRPRVRESSQPASTAMDPDAPRAYTATPGAPLKLALASADTLLRSRPIVAAVHSAPSATYGVRAGRGP